MTSIRWIIFFSLLPQLCLSQLAEFLIDSSQSQIQFQVKHLAVLTVTGEFENFTGAILFNASNQSEIQTEVFISSASISTRDNSRDKTVRSDQFLAVDSFPVIRFRSIMPAQRMKESWKLTGELQVKRVSNTVDLNYIIEEANNNSVKVKGTANISRKAFDLHFGGMDDLVGDLIQFDFDIVAVHNWNH